MTSPLNGSVPHGGPTVWFNIHYYYGTWYEAEELMVEDATEAEAREALNVFFNATHCSQEMLAAMYPALYDVRFISVEMHHAE